MNKKFNNYKSLSVQAKAALWFTICSFMQKGISFIAAPLFTRIMSTDQYGTYSVYLSWLQIFTVICTLYIFNGVNDNAMSKFDNDRDGFISSMQGLEITITSIVFIVILLFIDAFKNILELPPLMIYLMFIEIYATPALLFWSGRQRFEYRYKKLVCVTLIKSILNPVLGLVVVFFAEEKALARIVSTTFVEVSICGIIMITQFFKGRVFCSAKYWKYAITLAIPMLPHYLSGIVLNHGDRIVISKLLGNSDVALYGVAYSIGMLVQMFVSAVNSALTPWIYQKLKEQDVKSIKNKSRALLLFIFFISVTLMLVSPELVRIFGSKYSNASVVIPPVAGSVFFIFLYGLLSFPEFYYEKTRYLMIASLMSAVLNLILNYAFVPVFGYVAAAYTTLACYVIYSIGHYFVARKILGKVSNESSVVDDTSALVLAVMIILISSFIYILFPFVFIRFFLIVVGACIAFYNRNRIISFLRDIE